MRGKRPDIRVAVPRAVRGVELQTGAGVTGDVPRHWHEEYQICAITAGYGQMQYRGSSNGNPAGSINLVEPGEVHSNHTNSPTGCDFLKLDFDASLFEMAHELAPGSRYPAFSIPTIHDARTFLQFLQLHRLLRSGADPIEQQSAFLNFLATLLRRHMRVRGTATSTAEPRSVRMVREFLSDNYARKVELGELTALTGLSPFHLTRVFTRETGMPPHAFLGQVRIARAKGMLGSRLPISQVALATGFSDQSHFTRAFQSVVRVSPAVYRRSKNVQEFARNARQNES